jgi:hypothetical protein
LAPFLQIFLFFESARHLGALGAQRFALCFTSAKNLKELCVRARAPAYARASAMGLAFKE